MEEARTAAVERFSGGVSENIQVTDFLHAGHLSELPEPRADRAVGQRLSRYPRPINCLMRLTEDMKVENIFFPWNTSLHQPVDYP